MAWRKRRRHQFSQTRVIHVAVTRRGMSHHTMRQEEHRYRIDQSDRGKSPQMVPVSASSTSTCMARLCTKYRSIAMRAIRLAGAAGNREHHEIVAEFACESFDVSHLSLGREPSSGSGNSTDQHRAAAKDAKRRPACRPCDQAWSESGVWSARVDAHGICVCIAYVESLRSPTHTPTCHQHDATAPRTIILCRPHPRSDRRRPGTAR